MGTKIIISHDVDHIKPFEHKRDLILPKFIVRNFIEYVIGNISTLELKNRFKSIIENKWQNIEELMRFDRENEVVSTFFLAVNNGKGLSYSLEDAEFWIKRILGKGFNVGVHGIGYENLNSINREHKIFRSLSGLKKFGIRMHYLRVSKDILKFLNKAGYLFDSSLFRMSNPYKVGKIWEFPLHVMDSYVFYDGSRWQNRNLKQAIETTKRTLERTLNKDIQYFTILFHDRYFSDAYMTWKDWYIWVIKYLKDNGFRFTDYHQAIKEMKLH